MTARPTAKLGGYAWLAALGLVGGVALGRPELVAVAAPFVLIMVLALSRWHEPRLSLRVTSGPERVEVSEPARVDVRVQASADLSDVELELEPESGLAPLPGNERLLVASTAESRTVELRLEPTHSGRHRVGRLRARARDRLGFFLVERSLVPELEILAQPHHEPLRSAVAGRETRLHGGDQVSRHRGEGIEFAELRPLAPGEPARRLSWRATARRGRPLVAERHPERSVDLVLFVDAFDPLGLGTADPAFQRSVAAAASVARRHLSRRDRVGLVSFGGTLGWLRPRAGAAQLTRIVDALLKTPVILSYAWKDVRSVPPGVIPSQASVVAFSPLLDERMNAALFDLRARGFDLILVEVSPLGALPRDPAWELAHRLWLLERDELRRRYRSLGVRVAEWRDGEPLEAVVDEVNRWQRKTRRVFA